MGRKPGNYTRPNGPAAARMSCRWVDCRSHFIDRMDDHLKILILEAIPAEVERIQGALREAHIAYTATCVDNREMFTRALDEFHPDLVLASYDLPAFDGLEVVRLERSAHPEIPLIVVSDALSGEIVAELLKAGARDYVRKDDLGRLPLAVTNALFIEEGIRARKAAERATRQRVKELSCLYDIQAIRADPGNDVDAILEKVAQRLGAAYQYPDLACARIQWRDRSFESADFKETARRDFQPLLKDGERIGSVEIFYKAESAGAGPPDFLPQERNLLAEIATGLALTIEHRHTQSKLKDSESKFHALADGAQDAVVLVDDTGKIAYWNPAAVRLFGYDAQEVLGESIHDLIALAPYRMSAKDGYAKFAHTGDGPVVGKTVEFEVLHRHGTRFPVELSVSSVEIGGRYHAIGIVRDLTQRRAAEKKIRDLVRFLAQDPYPVWRIGRDGELLYANDASASVLESYDAAVGRPAPLSWTDSAVAALDANNAGIIEVPVEDRTYAFVVAPVVEAAYADFYGTDITDRKRAEHALQQRNRMLQTLSAGNEMVVRARNEDELLAEICRIVVDIGGYAAVWVGYAEHDPDCTIRVAASSPKEKRPSDSAVLTWADNAAGQHPAALAIRRGGVQVIRDVAAEPGLQPWREEILAAGFVSGAVLPLKAGDAVLGVLHIMSTEVDPFTDEELDLLRELAEDTAFGIVAVRTQAERNRLQEEALRATEKAKRALNDTIRAIALTVEKRDPYTAGHQQRVAELAAAIAARMGLSADRIEGIRLGGTIHDIGKLYVPAEILNRPGRLSEAEMSLIKTHPQVGYDIVRGVEFPWPVAAMVLQHHERLDGSGYPGGLKNGEIVLEARVLAVADVVESMTAHRPYRPGFGLDVALEEIKRGRGTLYATAVVDACVQVCAERSLPWLSPNGQPRPSSIGA